MTKICGFCKIRKDYSEFHSRGERRGHGRAGYCKSCSKIESRQRGQAIKLVTFSHYGGAVCACCGEHGHIAFLALDHIGNNGNEERKTLPHHKSGLRFYAYLKSKGFPEGYQVLCHTCNVAKYIMGECPHKFQLSARLIGRTAPSEGAYVGSSPAQTTISGAT